MSTRTVHCWEREADSDFISGNNWLWQIAKAVTSGSGSSTSNVIWSSQGLAPNMAVSWDVIYALNWTATVPDSGVTVTIGGVWQECAKGEVYDLNANGFWTSSSATPQPGWMKVGNVDYQYPGVQGIHIVIGVKNGASGNFDVIYVDPPALNLGSSGVYQPQEQVKWWYQGGNMTGQVYSGTFGSVGTVDLTNPAPDTGKYEWWTTYTSVDGKWTNSETAPPSSLTAPPISEHLYEVEIYPVCRWAFFSIVVGAAMRPQVRNFVYNQLSSMFTGVEVEFQGADGKVFRIYYGAPRTAKEGTREIIGAATGKVGDPDAPIQSALQMAKPLLPDNETWNLKKSPK